MSASSTFALFIQDRVPWYLFAFGYGSRCGRHIRWHRLYLYFCMDTTSLNTFLHTFLTKPFYPHSITFCWYIDTGTPCMRTRENNKQEGLVGDLRWTRRILTTACQPLRELLVEPPIVLFWFSINCRLHKVGRLTVSARFHWLLVNRVALRHLSWLWHRHLQSWYLCLYFKVHWVCLPER